MKKGANALTYTISATTNGVENDKRETLYELWRRAMAHGKLPTIKNMIDSGHYNRIMLDQENGPHCELYLQTKQRRDAASGNQTM